MAQMLIDAGMIILGKTNMTVSCGTVCLVQSHVHKLTKTGIRWDENDHDDAGMVILRWADDIALCRRNRDWRNNFGSLGESMVRAA